MRKILLLTQIFITALSLEISAQQIVTDRPAQTESSVTIPKNSFQIETGFLTGYTNSYDRTERQFLVPTTLLRYGVTKSIELRIAEQLEYHKIGRTSHSNFGISDLELGTKIQILRKDDINTEIAFLTHIIIPTGSDSITAGIPAVINKIAISHVINDFLGFGYNLGYSYLGEGNGDLPYSAVLGIGISEKTGIYAELYGELTGFKDIVSNFDSGFTYLVKDNF